MDEQNIIDMVELHFRVFVDFVIRNCIDNINIKTFYEQPFPKDFSIDTAHLKCNIINRRLHGHAYGKFVKDGLIINCNFESGKLYGPIEASFPDTYVQNVLVTHTSTHVE